MNIPLNRVVAFFGPIISVLAGGIATWLVAKVDVLGLPHLNQGNTQTYVAAALTFVVTAGLTWLGHQKWLTGHHIELQANMIDALARLEATYKPLSFTPLVSSATGTNVGGQGGTVETTIPPGVSTDPTPDVDTSGQARTDGDANAATTPEIGTV